jgi:quercetin dioxygenase-like cupin family protein
MRCDRVDFPPGGVAYTHTHQGPGIRVLLHGRFRVHTGGHTLEIAPGDPWFESGPDPVYAEASRDDPTSFIRVMVLPLTLLGKSSIRYVNPEDQARPKTQTYTVFVDAPLTR